MDEAVENADRCLFDYVTKYYPELGISYQDELSFPISREF